MGKNTILAFETHIEEQVSLLLGVWWCAQWMISMVIIGALGFLQCFDTVGWVACTVTGL